MKDKHIETLCLQGGYNPGNGQPRQLPIVQSTTFRYETSADMAKLFDLESNEYMYSRLANPTCDQVAQKIAALEGGSAAMLTSSGQAANFYTVFNIASAGDHIVASSTIYGGTFNLFSVTMKRMGIDFTFVDPDCTAEELDAAFRPNTKAVFGETIANPALTVLDIEKFACAAHEHGVLSRQRRGLLDATRDLHALTRRHRRAHHEVPPVRQRLSPGQGKQRILSHHDGLSRRERTEMLEVGGNAEEKPVLPSDGPVLVHADDGSHSVLLYTAMGIFASNGQGS